MFQRTSIHLRRTHNKYIRKKPTNPINQNKNDTFLKRYKSTSWHDKNLSKRFKSSSAAPPSSTPSSAAFSEAMAQHEEEENIGKAKKFKRSVYLKWKEACIRTWSK